MLEVLLLALALSMDAFAVSIGLGARRFPRLLSTAFRAGLMFGLFQALMPLIGHAAGIGVLGYIKDVDHWVAFGLLAAVGGKMIYESMDKPIKERVAGRLTNGLMLVLALATSIDALAVGFTLSFFEPPPWLSVVVIGATTFLFSAMGVYVGDRTGKVFESRAEMLGGIILITIGIRILLEHLGAG